MFARIPSAGIPDGLITARAAIAPTIRARTTRTGDLGGSVRGDYSLLATLNLLRAKLIAPLPDPETVIYSPMFQPDMEVNHERQDQQNPTGYLGGNGRRIEFLLLHQHRSSNGDAGLLLGRG